jgi:K+-sensing histidine kinase KdpD
MHSFQEGGSGSSQKPSVGWDDVVRFVRQLSHDLRNSLNAIELQAALLAESATDPNQQEDVGRLRSSVSEMGRSLQKMTAALQPPAPHLMRYGAADFVEDLQERVAGIPELQRGEIQWQTNLQGEMLEIDPQRLSEAVLELFRNSVQHEPASPRICCSARTAGGHFVFELRETKPQFAMSTEGWGREPLRMIGRGHYGLGLFRARTIIESHHGNLRAEYDPKTNTLISTITLPLLQNGG